MPKPPTGDCCCEATMSDGSTGVLFASCQGPVLGVAMSMASETWKQHGLEPVEIRVYAGGRDKAEGRVLAKWQDQIVYRRVRASKQPAAR